MHIQAIVYLPSPTSTSSTATVTGAAVTVKVAAAPNSLITLAKAAAVALTFTAEASTKVSTYGHGPADIARNVIGCHLTQETRIVMRDDDVAWRAIIWQASPWWCTLPWRRAAYSLLKMCFNTSFTNPLLPIPV